MPCRCYGVRTDKCNCPVETKLRHGTRNRTVVLSHETLCYRPPNAIVKPNILLRIIENIYDGCAEYNLRYCPFRGFSSKGNYISKTLKDFIILICFLVANFVVFSAILIKIILHMSFVIKDAYCWLERYIDIQRKGSFSETSIRGTQRMDNRFSPPTS